VTILLPFNRLSRLTLCVSSTKEKVLEANAFLLSRKLTIKSFRNQSGYPFWNISKFTFETMLNEPTISTPIWKHTSTDTAPMTQKYHQV
jgi:hypothetical protein